MTDKVLNLDKKAAELAQDIVNKAGEVKDVSKPIDTLERLVNKALGVLQEHGVYALMLFLFSRSSDEAKIAPVIRKAFYDALKALPGLGDRDKIQGLNENGEAKEVLRVYTEEVLEDLDTLLLVRDFYEQILIYARYGAKAAGG